ncbi:MAG: hypothetical protein Q7U57_03865 [Methylovulum sp.]|nr:hypothetical protein [Methylovulum sp.]
MCIKLSIFAVSLTALMAASAYAGDIKPLHGVAGSLGNGEDATDIIRFSCGTLEGVTVDHAFATIQDLDPVQKPELNIKIAAWTGSHCGSFSTAEPDTVDDDGLAGAEVEVGMPAVGGQFCLKVFKKPGRQNGATGHKTAYGAENYEIDTGCGQEGLEEHAEPIFDAYIKNQ